MLGKLLARSATPVLAMLLSSSALAQHCSADWTPEYKCLEGCGPCAGAAKNGVAPTGPTSLQQMQMQGAQQLGTAVGNQLGKALFGSPEDDAKAQDQLQLKFAAQQLNNSGIYLLKQKNYAGAINEFQQALERTPDDRNILSNLALAKQKLKDTGAASQNANTLSQVLTNSPADTGAINFDQLTHSSLPSPNSSVLNLVNLNSDANVVDLSHATKKTVDPASLKAGSNGLVKNGSPVSVPPDSRLQLPESKDMEFLGQIQGATPAGQAPPMKTEAQMKAEMGRQFDAIFAQPGGLDDVLEKEATGVDPK